MGSEPGRAAGATLLEALMEHCGAAALVLDRTDRIVHANRLASERLGSATRPLAGRTLLEATISADVQRLLREARGTGAAASVETTLDGRTYEVTIVPVEEPSGACLVIGRDVTELRHLATVRRDFVANVSHELRTPLASIRAMAETLQHGALEDPAVSGRFLETIVSESQRLARISDDLLVLSQAESGLAERAPVDFTALVDEAVERFRPQAAQAGIALEVRADAGLALEASRDQLEQVLVNLVDNAIKYTPEGGRVAVTASAGVDGGVEVRVHDTGIGIMMRDQPRIFERFYRVDKARSRRSGGTGLGLAIVKHIVESHGGQVTVQSALNRGSTFTVWLPAR